MVVVKDSVNSTDPSLSDSSLHTGQGVIVDIGTGDGRFVYQSARRNPDKFYIGIDASPAGLVEISAKVQRKPAKGGAANAIFVQARVEELPGEFNNIADEVHVHFPWGSLLSALLKPSEEALVNIRAICRRGALVEILTAIDLGRDRRELERLDLHNLIGASSALSGGRDGSLASMVPPDEYVREKLMPAYQQARLPVREHGFLPSSDWSKVCSSWGKKLAQSTKRSGHYLVAEAV